MILEEAISFLKNNPPFQFLDEAKLQDIAHSLSMEYYPKDSVILKQDGPSSDAVRIIKKGGVKILMRAEGGIDTVIDYRGEGDTFGFLSLIGKARQTTSVVASEDTICYILGKERVFKLIETSPAFSEYFMSYLSKYVDRTYREMQGRSDIYSGTDRLLFTTRAGDIAKEVVTVPEDTSIQEAAGIMVKNKISSIVIFNKNNLPAGIITDRDLREKVVARNYSVTEPVKNIMTIALIRVDANDSCFDAVLKMIKYKIHHMLVIKDGELKGIMTNHDLMLLHGTSPLSFVNDIEKQQTVEGLIPVSGKINNITGLLLHEGARAGSIIKIITEINDRLVKKVLEIADNKFGQPPVPYCWIVFGSEGRKEQTFKTDQDNALIYADTRSAEEDGKAKKYFSEFTEFVRDCLIKTGFPPCRAGYMASTPDWRQPLTVWKGYFQNWIAEPIPDAVLKSLIFFDARPLHGKFALYEELSNFYLSLAKRNEIFLGHMANMIIRNTPPVGFLKSFVVEKSGEHKDEFDLKVKGITPLNDIVRLFALENGIKQTPTPERIDALKDKHPIVRQYYNEIEHTFEFIMMLRIHSQFEQIKEGRSPGNFINPDKLSTLEKKTIKETFHLISKLQDMVIEKYRPLIV